MTRNELIGQLMLEGFPLREAEHEADLIQGSLTDDMLPAADAGAAEFVGRKYFYPQEEAW